MKIKWYGTAGVSFETENSAIIFDPYIPCRGSETPSAEAEFLRFKDIIITHGHFDHVSTLPKTVKKSGAKIWCTVTPYVNLSCMGIPDGNLRKFAPGDVMEFGDIKVTPFRSLHVKYDKKLLKSIIFSFRVIRRFGNLVKLAGDSLDCTMGDEIVGFLIEAEGKRIYLMGSLGWRDDTEYPDNVDLLVMPYQGTSDLLTPALQFIEMTHPKAIFLDHFDDTFPPLSSHIDTSDIVAALEGKIPVTVPVFNETYEY